MFLSAEKYNELKEREVKIMANFPQPALNSIFLLSTGLFEENNKRFTARFQVLTGVLLKRKHF
jgi:hypothetical protein